MMRLIVVLLLFIFSLSNSYAQKVKIKIRINDLKDTTVLLGYHFRDKLYTVDSIRLNSKGKAVLKKNELYTPGQYFIYFPNNKLFDILIDEDQKFYVRNNSAEFVKDFKVRGSVSNKLMAKYNRKISDLNTEINNFRKLEMKARNIPDSAKYYREKINESIGKQKEIQQQILSGDNQIFYYSLMQTTIDPLVPDDIQKSDTAELMQFYRENYLNNVNFSDPRLIRSNYLYKRINDYLSGLIYPHYDSLIYAVDEIIERASANKEMEKFVSEHLLAFFALSKYMTHKNVFVHIAETYYLSGKADWVNEEKLKKITERVQSIKPTLVDQVAPDLKISRIDGTPFSLHELVAEHTILIIYEPECGHCKQAVSQILELSEKYWENGVEVFAMYSLVDLEPWSQFIEEMALENWNNVYDPDRTSNFYDLYNVITTPRIFLLDNNKKIILSDVGVEQIRGFLENIYGK